MATSDIGHLKLNVDASTYACSNSFSIGTILRDHNGLFLKRKTMKFPGKVQVFEAEAVGVYEAMHAWGGVDYFTASYSRD